ncbi:type II toxin-antitoxin system RelE/ParE family toxin [Polynucleobacter sp.]|uniref:type II toxin-antitoxin system RelE/ParE family toxin n=1 Tax=Polynucleobacter sp. TaxID=2029855 RepID=UPI003340A353
MLKKRSFKTETFSRWIKKAELQDTNSLQAIKEMESGLIDADLGDYVYKKRVALKGLGKRSGG